MASQVFLEIKNLSKHYFSTEALKGVSFSIRKGEVHALVGENGAGKSTLIKILSGAVQPDAGGCIELAGEEYAPGSPKGALDKGIATIYQSINLLPDRSIMHNVMLGKESTQSGIIDSDRMRQSTRDILASLGSSYLDPDRIVSGLKVGEKQVVEIAKSLVNNSELLIMDEPTAALNQQEIEALFINIRKLRDQGVTIIYVSHRLDEIFDLADSVTVFRDGQHILTQPIGKVTREKLIQSMIGRKLENLYPRKNRPSDEEILSIKDLSLGKELKDITFNLHRGEVLAIAGLSGCGKTELGKALYGALPIQKGEIFVNQKRFRPTPRHSIKNGMIFLPEDRKDESMLQLLNIRRNLSLSVLNSKVGNRLGLINFKKEEQIASEQVESLKIKLASLDQNVMFLSGGNQQKVALGRCLAVDPDVLVLLEPTQGIDVGVKFELYQFITSQAQQGKAVILITSELAEVMGLSHRVLVMCEGSIVADLETEKTNREEILRYALGEKSSQE